MYRDTGKTLSRPSAGTRTESILRNTKKATNFLPNFNFLLLSLDSYKNELYKPAFDLSHPSYSLLER